MAAARLAYTILLVTLLVGTQTAHSFMSLKDLKKYDTTSVTLTPTGDGVFFLRFTAFDQPFIARLHETEALAQPSFLLHDGSGADRSLELLRSTRMYSGSVDGWSHSTVSVTSSAHDDDSGIYARLVSHNDTLHVEPQLSGDHIVYWASDVAYSFNESLISKQPDLATSRGVSVPQESFFAKFSRQTRAVDELEPIRKNRCELKLVADYAFFKLIGQGNYANAARYLVNMIVRANDIYTAVDWGRSIGGRRLVNMGFVIKEMKILDKPNNTAWTGNVPHFNSEHPRDSSGQFNPMDVLTSFSIEEGTESSCLTFLISGKVFTMSILGLANIAQTGSYGLCARKPYNKLYMNTGTLSVQRQSGLIITRVVDLVFAHEMGHLWGAGHDDPTNPLCLPDSSTTGRYIMHASSNSGYDTNNYKFSPCSIQAIFSVLYGLAEECFVDERAALCGNGLVEPGESCDPGGRLAYGHAADDDRCCTSACQLRPRARCSPKHSECCTERCIYADSSERCQTRSPATCKEAAYCTGQSDQCPEPRAVRNGTQCVDDGTCRNGECISFCAEMTPGWSPCTCENVSESCLRCCRSPSTGICMPVKPARPLPEGSICIHGHCKSQVCVQEATDAATHFWRIIKDIGANPSPKYFADYIVFIIVVASLIVWCPCGLYILYRDRQRVRVREAQAATEDVYVVPKTKRLRRITSS